MDGPAHLAFFGENSQYSGGKVHTVVPVQRTQSLAFRSFAGPAGAKSSGAVRMGESRTGAVDELLRDGFAADQGARGCNRSVCSHAVECSVKGEEGGAEDMTSAVWSRDWGKGNSTLASPSLCFLEIRQSKTSRPGQRTTTKTRFRKRDSGPVPDTPSDACKAEAVPSSRPGVASPTRVPSRIQPHRMEDRGTGGTEFGAIIVGDPSQSTLFPSPYRRWDAAGPARMQPSPNGCCRAVRRRKDGLKLSELVATSFGCDGCVEAWTTLASSLRKESLGMADKGGYQGSRSRVPAGRSTVGSGREVPAHDREWAAAACLAPQELVQDDDEVDRNERDCRTGNERCCARTHLKGGPTYCA